MKKKLLYLIVVISILAINNYIVNPQNGLSTLSLDSLKIMAQANAAECDGRIETHKDAYCKNGGPGMNCGYCYETSTGIRCVGSESHTKDCYDTGF